MVNPNRNHVELDNTERRIMAANRPKNRLAWMTVLVFNVGALALSSAVAEPVDPPPARGGERDPGPDDRPRDGRGRHRRHAHRGPWAGPGGERGRGDFDVDALPPDVLDRFLDEIRERVPPEKFDRLMRLRERNPRRFRELVQRRLGPIVHEYVELHRTDPAAAETIFEEFRAQGRLHELSDALQNTDDAEKREQIESEMRELVKRQMESMLQRRKLRLEYFAQRLERQRSRLEEERARIEDDAGRLEELVSQRMEQIKQGRLAPPGDLFSLPGEGRRDRDRDRIGRRDRDRFDDRPRHRPRGLFDDDDPAPPGSDDDPRDRDPDRPRRNHRR